MSYAKTYTRINWENEPSVSTPLNEANLNRMDYSLDQVDTACQTLDTSKANQADLQTCLSSVTYDTTTGQFVFTWKNGSSLNVDLNIEKIPVTFSMDANGVITMTTEDGTEYTADVGALIKTYSFVNSSQIDFEVTTDASGNKTITATIIDGSITEEMLEPQFLAQIKVEVTKSENAANASKGYKEQSEAWAAGTIDGSDIPNTNPAYHNNSKYYMEQTQGEVQNAEAWARGTKNGTPVPSTDPTYENNSKYYAEQAESYKDQAAAIVGIGIATTTTAGIVKPDGSSITVDPDGTIHGGSQIEISGKKVIVS